ncbi:MAG: flagellar export chaperone FlgN [Planctomycetota bacterium]|jgi:hypothetical protein
MKATTRQLEDKVDELIAVLNKDVRHIRQTLSRLNELRALLIRRDDVALGKLLESIQAESADYGKVELQRRTIRKELAIALGCDFGQLTLGGLETALPEEQRLQVVQLKKELKSLVEDLKREHLGTMLLLSECARFNNVLLQGIFNLGRAGTVTYDASGSARRHSDMAFVNLHF